VFKKSATNLHYAEQPQVDTLTWKYQRVRIFRLTAWRSSHNHLRLLSICRS